MILDKIDLNATLLAMSEFLPNLPHVMMLREHPHVQLEANGAHVLTVIAYTSVCRLHSLNWEYFCKALPFCLVHHSASKYAPKLDIAKNEDRS
jgi:hypothetical protein